MSKRRRLHGRRRPSAVRRVVRSVLLAGALLTGGAVLMSLAGCFESSLFYFPNRSAFETPAGVEDVRFPSREEGIELHGWFIPARGVAAGEAAPTVLHVHGNAFHVARHLAVCEWLADEGFNVLLFDYRGYGRSDRGRLLRDGLVADAHGAIDYLLTREDVDPERIGLFGFSMGGTIGLAAAAEREEIRAVAAGSTFSTWKGVTGDYAGGLGRLLIPAGRDAAASAARLGEGVGRPLLITHGDADRIVNVRHAALLERAASEAGVRVAVHIEPGAGHVTWVNDPAEVGVKRAIAEFFREELAVRETDPASGGDAAAGFR